MANLGNPGRKATARASLARQASIAKEMTKLCLQNLSVDVLRSFFLLIAAVVGNGVTKSQLLEQANNH